MSRFPLTYITLISFKSGFNESVIATNVEAIMLDGGNTEDVHNYLADNWPTWFDVTVEVAL